MMPTSHLSGLIRPCLMPRNLNQVSDGGESEADGEVHVYFCYLVIAFPPLFPHSIIYLRTYGGSPHRFGEFLKLDIAVVVMQLFLG